MSRNWQSEDIQWVNCIVDDVELRIAEDIDSMSFEVVFHGEGGTCSLDWYNLGGWLEVTPSAGSMLFVLMKTLGITKLSEAKGRYVRAGFDRGTDKCIALMHIIDSSMVFCIDDFKEIAMEGME